MAWDAEEKAFRTPIEDLRKIPPGLDQYLNHRQEDHHSLSEKNKAALRCFLDLLPCARGPLSGGDVLELAPETNELGIEKILDALRHSVAGDGISLGFDFIHPRFREHYYSRLSDAEKKMWQDRFLDYGRRTLESLNSGELPPENASAYLVQFYCAHLESDDCGPDELIALVSDGWRMAWEHLEGAYSGFMNDVYRAWRASVVSNIQDVKQNRLPAYIGCEVRCALVKSSVEDLVEDVCETLAMELVKSNIWSPDQAVSHARQVRTETERVTLLAHLSRFYKRSRLSGLLNDALDCVHGYEPEYRLEMLEVIVPLLEEPNVLRQAYIAAQRIDTPKYRARALALLADKINEPDRRVARVDGLEAARAAEFWEIGSRSLSAVTRNLSESERGKAVDEALEAALAIKWDDMRSRALSRIAPSLMDPGQIRKACEAIRATEYKRHCPVALAAMAQNVNEPEKSKLLDEALDIVGTIEAEGYRSQDLVAIVPCLSDTEHIKKAIELASGIKDPYERFEALEGIASYLKGPDRQEVLTAAYNTARRVWSRGEAIVALRDIAPYVKEPYSSKALNDALRYTRTNSDKGSRSWDLAHIALNLEEPERSAVLVEALEVASAVVDNNARREALGSAASGIKDPGLLRDALVTVRKIDDPRERAEALAGIACGFEEPEKGKILKEALKLALEIKATNKRSWTLTSIAPQLKDPELQNEILERTGKKSGFEESLRGCPGY